MTLFTFGDSHAREGWRDLRIENLPIKVNHLGPKTMFTFGRLGPNLLNLREYGVHAGDAVVFCFGEIDARCHVGKQPDPCAFMKNLVLTYFKAMVDTTHGHGALDVGVYSIPPAIHAAGKPVNPEYPYVGTDDMRSWYVCYLNNLIEAGCKQLCWKFVDVHSRYCDRHGFLVEALSDGGPHIKDTAFLEGVVCDLFGG